MEFSYIKHFDYNWDNYSDLTFSDATKLHLYERGRCLRLKKQSDGYYPTDTGLYVETASFNPTALTSWVLLDDDWKSPIKMSDGSEYGVRRYKIKSGGLYYYWTGSAWATTAVGDNWNTLAGINQGMSSLTLNPIQLVINIYTTDKEYTPELYWNGILCKVDVDPFNDLFYKLVIPAFQSISFQASAVIYSQTGVKEIDLTDPIYKFDADYNISSVVSVYNITDDPSKATNLFDVYSNNIIYLTTSVPNDKNLLVTFNYTVGCVLTQRYDYSQLAQIPVMYLSDVVPEETLMSGHFHSYVRDKASKTATGVRLPRETDFTFDLNVLTDKAIENLKVCNAVKEYFARNSSKRISYAEVDGEVLMQMESDDFEAMTSILEGEVGGGSFESTARFRIIKFPFFIDEDISKYIITEVLPTVSKQL